MSFFERGEEGHLDLPRAREGGFAGGLFACFVPSESGDTELPAPDQGGYAVPFPARPASSGRARSPWRLPPASSASPATREVP